MSDARFEESGYGGPLLEVTDLTTSFSTDRGVVRAVDGVSLTLERGKTLGIVGESGSGKTVLSRSIMNLLPKRGLQREGSVRFEGKEISELPADAMRHYWGAQMAMIFQDPMTSLNPVMKIGNQITEAIREHLDVTPDYAGDLAESLLASVRIPEPHVRLNEYPHQLSGGMRQRVCIAVALACGPKLLFADEPTTALDVTVQAQVLDLIAGQQAERFMAMVLVTHDLGVVAGRAERVAVMYAGRVVEEAPTGVLFADMKMPYSEALLASIPKLDAHSHVRLNTIPGRPPDLVHPPAGCKFAPRCPYVQDRCLEEEPPLRAGPTAGHQFRCWFPVGTPEGQEARAKNEREGRVPAAAVAGGH
ncbi:MAG TPA: ABC transporter ATP-binding protein [Acidimicrobiia bacterium]